MYVGDAGRDDRKKGELCSRFNNNKDVTIHCLLIFCARNIVYPRTYHRLMSNEFIDGLLRIER